MSTNRMPTMSTDEIYRGENTNRGLTEELDNIDSALEALDSEKAPNGHTHEDLERAVDALDEGKAPNDHGHAISDITGLPEKLNSIDEEIAELKKGGGSSGERPIAIASMHKGKLDNNSGAEVVSSTRICSDPFAVENGKTYKQVNDKAVNMYVLLYDADETFLEYLGNFASGAEIAVNNVNAAYMRISSLIGEYDLTNEFRIYDVSASSGGSTPAGDGYSKAEADARFAPASHTHAEYAPANSVYSKTEADEKFALKSEGGGSGTPVDAYTKTEADSRFAPKTHNHTEYAPNDHTHNGYAPSTHYHPEYSPSSHAHDYAPSNHSHSDYFSKNGGTIDGETNVNGVFRVNGQQAVFDSGSMITLGTNNRETMIAGSKIYSKVPISTSSDERLKEGIESVDVEKCVDFINAVNVKTFNYIGSDTPCIGVIAQDIQRTDLAKFFVSVVPKENPEDEEYLAVKLSDMVFPLIVAYQALEKRVAELEAKD